MHTPDSNGHKSMCKLAAEKLEKKKKKVACLPFIMLCDRSKRGEKMENKMSNIWLRGAFGNKSSKHI